MNKTILLALILAVTVLVGFKHSKTAKETMTIVVSQNGDKKMLVSVSTSGNNPQFEQKVIIAQNKDDYSDALKIVKEYQHNGWQIKNSNYAKNIGSGASDGFYLFFLLEK